MISSLLLVLAGVVAAPTLQIEGPVLEGQQVILHLTDGKEDLPGIAITAKYRQNAHAALQHDQDLGATGPDGRISWTPEEAGVVVISWAGGEQNVSVCHSGVPASGVIVLILAGVLLLGGATRYFFKMLKEG
jgi:hypothetical protein